MKITWLGHACFKMETKGYTVVIDPYEDHYVPGLGKVRETANEVLVSHGHRDHNFTEAVEVNEKTPSPLVVTVLGAFHDKEKGSLRGTTRIHMIEDGEIRAVHLGDLGCDLTPEQKEQLKGVDALLIPVGGYYTIDAAEAKKLVDELQPRVVIPMHYRGEEFGYDVLDTVDSFAELFEVVVEYPGNELEISEETAPHTAILTLEQREE